MTESRLVEVVVSFEDEIGERGQRVLRSVQTGRA
jgi:hypothetical protein